MNFDWGFERFTIGILCLVLGAVFTPASASNVGLVIGNTNYPGDLLRTASTDAKLVADALELKGFEVKFAADPSFFEFKKLISDFGERSTGADVSVFYYAGHGIVLGDLNYLVPTDIHLRSRSDRRNLPWLQDILIAGTEAERSVTILDTCFVSDFARGWGDRLGRSSLCPDSEPQVKLEDKLSLVFTNSQTRPPSAQSEGAYASILASELESADSLMAWLDETATKTGAQSESGEQPVFFGSRADISISADIETSTGKNSDDARIVESEPPPSGLVVEPGEYLLNNLFRSSVLVDAGNGIPLMSQRQQNSSEPSARWIVRQDSSSTLTISNAATKKYLGVSDLGTVVLVNEQSEASTIWTAIPIDEGLDNAVHLYNEAAGQYFRVSGRASSLSVDDTPGSAGWLLEIQEATLFSADASQASEVSESDDTTAITDATGLEQPELGALAVQTVPTDSRVRILNIQPAYVDGIELARGENYQIEVSRDGYTTDTRWVRLEEEELIVRVELERSTATDEVVADNGQSVGSNSQPAQVEESDKPAQQYAITREDRNTALTLFNQLSEALREPDTDFILSRLPDSEKREILNDIASQYAEIDARVIALNSDNDSQSVYATLRLMRLKKADGDIVIPAESYRDFALMQSRNDDGEWSGLLWADK
jgi:hypothetical protein